MNGEKMSEEIEQPKCLICGKGPFKNLREWVSHSCKKMSAKPVKVGPPMDRIIGYRKGVCADCEWHPDVCEHCQMNLHPTNQY